MLPSKKKTYSDLIKRTLAYVQGQSPEPKIREYFYFVNHEGMVSYSRQFSTQIKHQIT